MKHKIINTLAVLAVIAGIIIGAVCNGVPAFICAISLSWAGAVTLISGSTDWIEKY